ncbi:hypothetical protein GZL_01683 [Streptomyces sp. 769]|nr:hypothetical protein GZL_01683 [Streptomyces sp. 769]
MKAGLAAEGVRRSAELHLDGWHDMHEHGCVQGDLPNADTSHGSGRHHSDSDLGDLR